jgi:recombination protein RecR
MNPKFKQTTKLLQKLPGVGPRQATRFILALLEKDDSELRELGQAISNLKTDIRFCKNCFNISEGMLCHICNDQKRDFAKLLVVEKVTDLESMEKTGIYKGFYHVLGGAINPLDGATPDNLHFNELAIRVDNLSKNGQLELIIATNPSTTGETTALYIRDLFKDKKDILLTRLGRGLASGSNLEYADELTLKHALEYRK